jgi:thioredoxin reductase (NADPH)
MQYFDIGYDDKAKETKNTHYDLVIIGGGPAGLTAAIYACRGGLKTLVLEKGIAGGTLNFTPLVENYPPFTSIKGMELGQQWTEHAEKAGALFLQEAVGQVDFLGERLVIETETGRTISSKTAVISTGASYKRLGLAAEKRLAGKGVSYCALCDGALFKNKKIAVIGGGNSAIDEALYLAQIAESVTIVHRRNQLRAEKALAEKALNHPKIRVYWDSVLKAIEGEQKVESLVFENVLTGDIKREAFDGVFIYIGLVPQSQLFKGQLDMTEDGFILTDSDTLESSRKRVFAVGDVRKKEVRQIITAAGDGAVAASVLLKKYFL